MRAGGPILEVPGWVIFDRTGGGYLAVRVADCSYVEAGTSDELTVAIVVDDIVRSWREPWMPA